MRYILIFLLLFAGAVSAQNIDTTKLYRSNDYGWTYKRVQVRDAMLLPTDTTINKYGVSVKGTTMYIGNGSYWTAIQGGGGGVAGVDSVTYANSILTQWKGGVQTNYTISTGGVSQAYDSSSINYNGLMHIYYSAGVPVDSLSIYAAINIGNTNLTLTGNRILHGNGRLFQISNVSAYKVFTGNGDIIDHNNNFTQIVNANRIMLSAPDINLTTLPNNDALTKFVMLDGTDRLHYRNLSSLAIPDSGYIHSLIQTNIDSIAAHNNRIGANTSNIAANLAAIALKLNITDTTNMRIRPIAGTGMTITGTYPNLTFDAAGGGAALSLTTIGTGAATLVGGTLNIPTFLGASGGWNTLGGNVGGTYPDTLTYLGTNNNAPMRFKTNGIERMRIDSVGSFTFGKNVQELVSKPLNVSFGGTYGSNTPGSPDNLKWDMYNGGGGRYGIGMSSNLMEYQAGTGGSHGFFVPTVGRALLISALKLDISVPITTGDNLSRSKISLYGAGLVGFGVMSNQMTLNVYDANGRFSFYNGNPGTEIFTIKGNKQVGINNVTPHASSTLDIVSTTQGVLLPRLTTTQINAIASPANGLTVYNTTENTLCFFNGTIWQKVTSSAL